MQTTIEKAIIETLQAVRTKKPIVHHLTNYVTVNDCANCVLELGGSPIMADEIEEVEEITALSSSLVLNIGTINARTLESMIKAGKKAKELHLPIILDPVGNGASTYRTQAVKRILEEVGPSVIRGNLSEIRCLAGLTSKTQGVDASQTDKETSSEVARELAKTLARQLNCIVSITGKTDFISDGNRTLSIHNGHSRLAKVTGTGCMSTSLVGTCCGATSDLLMATTAGILCMGLAGELAQEECSQKGEGSFHCAILDQIGMLDAKQIAERGKIDVQ
ncbi:hydroxyethylthiazole kinase [uncultured Sphaerochaeta sp.]|uniref:hydroxyethylthiazole kinase n=1 Tax=uncultured Sphaerochaeta sp. TaxID=886478 RepID=UPI002A0A35FC|nr:hydroxyethylthiazole kinase [uncultured Sphaerochaeta sp.]